MPPVTKSLSDPQVSWRPPVWRANDRVFSTGSMAKINVYVPASAEHDEFYSRRSDRLVTGLAKMCVPPDTRPFIMREKVSCRTETVGRAVSVEILLTAARLYGK